ncbi:hypothetical protein EDD93_1921 [Streptomyces sp. 840.1]|uniref:DUF5707 domain-containing protein n=1 Tax=Streptomyces sp. 840.1 TaxID=2485152 RepID=UPI000F490A73|nr:DUF5707 domain-containing protein [Streptomyces sp. 840.1]ROQ67484.1 hypothetical protein EDD93_1921 [Streptomyces sp. 840.1]
MSKRILFSSLIAAVALGATAYGSLALASTPTEPALEHGSARYTAPSGSSAGSFTYTVDVRDESGIRSLKVLAWPASSHLDPTEAELGPAERAKCRSTSEGSARCVYTLKVTKREADLNKGTWHLSALATAEDGGTTFVPRAATFDITR